MRIGIDGLPLTQEKTGVGHYTSELANALASIAPAENFELVLPSGREIRSQTALLPNLRIVRTATNLPNQRGWWFFGLPRYCNRTSLDVFHGTNFAVPVWGRCASVLTVHDLSLLLYPETHEKRLVRWARRNLPLMMRRASAVITPTEAVKREVCNVLKVAAERVVAIPESARSYFRRVSTPETVDVRQRFRIEDDFILFVGTIEPRKNLLNLFRALEELFNTTVFRPQLVIAGGKGWLSDGLSSYLGSTRTKERVVFTGYLEDQDLRALYSSCRVFAYPSLYEGFGLPLLEAMACGAPVVTSNVPSIVETVGDVARLVHPQDFRALAHAIACLLQDTAERQNRSAAGLQHARKFSWEKTASATLEVYRRVVETHRRSHHSKTK